MATRDYPRFKTHTHESRTPEYHYAEGTRNFRRLVELETLNYASIKTDSSQPLQSLMLCSTCPV